MSLRWLSSMVDGKRFGRPGIRRKMAPEAQRDLISAIDTDAVAVRRMYVRDLVLDPDTGDEAEPTVIARLKVWEGSAIDAWVNQADADSPEPDVRTDWIFFPATPEAVLMCVAEDPSSGAMRFRFNLKFSADEYRRQLTMLAETGLLGVSIGPLQIDDMRHLESACAFVSVLQEPLRAFLREIPAPPVV